MKKQVVEKLAALITAAFGLVAALAWNEAIKELFSKIFAADDTLKAMVAYAVVVTTIAVFATIWIGNMSERFK